MIFKYRIRFDICNVKVYMVRISLIKYGTFDFNLLI